MSHFRTGCVVILLSGLVLVLHASAQDGPAGPASDPANDIIDGLLKQLDRPKPTAPRKKGTKVEPDQPATLSTEPTKEKPTSQKKSSAGQDSSSTATSVSAESVIEGVSTRADDLAARKIRNASVLFEQAKAAQKDGQIAEAFRLASAAKRMHPANKEIAEFAASLHKETSKSTLPYQARAVGRLAAGVARGQELMEQARYARAVDLLSHAIKAADLFPTDAGVMTYKRMAERELSIYRQRLERGEIQPDDSEVPGEDPILVANGSAAPLNARRLLRTVEKATPAWYAEIKNRLAFAMSVNYERRPVADIVEEIGKVTGVKLMIDETVLRSRTHINTLVNFRISDTPAERILDIACLQGGLEYVIMERGVIVTTPSRAARYIRDLPESVRQNWLAARVLFPEMTPELLASAPLPNALPGQAIVAEEELDTDVPPYLQTGAALLADIQTLLSAK
jgi:hypothetical protein